MIFYHLMTNQSVFLQCIDFQYVCIYLVAMIFLNIKLCLNILLFFKGKKPHESCLKIITCLHCFVFIVLEKIHLQDLFILNIIYLERQTLKVCLTCTRLTRSCNTLILH